MVSQGSRAPASGAEYSCQQGPNSPTQCIDGSPVTKLTCEAFFRARKVCFQCRSLHSQDRLIKTFRGLTIFQHELKQTASDARGKQCASSPPARVQRGVFYVNIALVFMSMRLFLPCGLPGATRVSGFCVLQLLQLGSKCSSLPCWHWRTAAGLLLFHFPDRMLYWLQQRQGCRGSTVHYSPEAQPLLQAHT
jgi:hypothetical protein